MRDKTCVKLLLWRRNDNGLILKLSATLGYSRIDGKHILTLLAVPSVPSCFRLTVAFWKQSSDSSATVWNDRETVRHQQKIGAEVSGHFGTSCLVPKYLGAKLSWCRSVLTPVWLVSGNSLVVSCIVIWWMKYIRSVIWPIKFSVVFGSFRYLALPITS